MSGACERVNGRANGPLLTSRFMAVLNHSGEGGGWDRGDIDGGGGDERERLWGSDGKGDGKLRGGGNDVMAVSS